MPERTLAVVDGNSIIHRAFHALPQSMTAPDGRPTNAAFGFVSMLVKMVQELQPQGVVVAWDCGKPAFRMEALEQYKSTRKPTAEELKQQFPMVKKLLDALDVPQIEIEGWEADDLLGTLACEGSERGWHVLLVTGDRDALQLVTDTVHVVSTKKGITDIKIYDPSAVEERFGVRPDQIIDYLGLKGDASDNIPGIPGIGEKTAAKLVAEYGSLDGVLEHAAAIKGKLGENIREHAEDARISRTVATIRCEVPIALDFDRVHWGTFSPEDVAKAFGELRFTSLLERVLATVPAQAAAGEMPAETAAPPLEWAVARGVQQARELLAGATREGGWLGVALDDGTAESLFAVRRDLALAYGGTLAIAEGEDAREVFEACLAAARIAAGDIKSILHSLCHAREIGGCDVTYDAVAPERLFDCAVAVYLLESHRSSFEVAALAADYLGRPLPEPTDSLPAVALEARAVAELAPLLEARLAEDGSAEVFETIEMPLVPVLARMERIGVGIDTDVLAGLKTEAEARIAEIRNAIYADAGCEFNIDSPRQLGEVLFEKLGLPASKRTKTGFSTDASVLTGLAQSYPLAERIMEYRELTKLTSTYIDALPRLLAEDGRLHTSFNQTVAATGRLSSSNPNLQNIPVRTEFGRRIRAAFIPAREGDLMVSADYSQIELRVLAHLSGDKGLIDAFTSGEDFHAATAARVFGVPADAVPPELRARAKAVNFGIVYGQSAHGLADTLKIPHAEAQTMIDKYYAAYPRVREFLDETVAAAHRDGHAVTMFGRKRRIPELKSSNYQQRAFGERTAMNHPMQGTAADIMKLAMIKVDRRLRKGAFASRMLLQVHDELVFEAPVEEVDALGEMAREAMGGVVELAVPLVVDVNSGRNWAEAK